MNDSAAGIHALVLVAIALAVAGCGASSEGESGAHPDYEKALAGAPPPLAALYEQANRLLPGGVDAYEDRISALRGYPVVVNLWASWCGPCLFEFPHFQQVAARYGKRVAFLGIDKEDSDDAASTFLRDMPVPYPSYTDPDEEIAESIDGDAARLLPTTVFYDRDGAVVFSKLGQYHDEAELRTDIERYALGRGLEGG
jgi:cytochrome c biogenesis protein CcmG, thiol:disulfide interchange protein DsbE